MATASSNNKSSVWSKQLNVVKRAPKKCRIYFLLSLVFFLCLFFFCWWPQMCQKSDNGNTPLSSTCVAVPYKCNGAIDGAVFPYKYTYVLVSGVVCMGNVAN